MISLHSHNHLLCECCGHVDTWVPWHLCWGQRMKSVGLCSIFPHMGPRDELRSLSGFGSACTKWAILLSLSSTNLNVALLTMGYKKNIQPSNNNRKKWKKRRKMKTEINRKMKSVCPSCLPAGKTLVGRLPH